jgi:hypothetical protein
MVKVLYMKTKIAMNNNEALSAIQSHIESLVGSYPDIVTKNNLIEYLEGFKKRDLIRDFAVDINSETGELLVSITPRSIEFNV